MEQLLLRRRAPVLTFHTQPSMQRKHHPTLCVLRILRQVLHHGRDFTRAAHKHQHIPRLVATCLHAGTGTGTGTGTRIGTPPIPLATP